MLDIVGADGQVFLPFWTEGTAMSTQYETLMAHKVFRALDKPYGIGNWCWTQDDAPMSYLQLHPEEHWKQAGVQGILIQRSNLNPLDYLMWSAVERKACAIYLLCQCWRPEVIHDQAAACFPKTTVKPVCENFCPCFEVCIAAEGGIFEKNSKRNH